MDEVDLAQEREQAFISTLNCPFACPHSRMRASKHFGLSL